jgi:hypothetical protein
MIQPILAVPEHQERKAHLLREYCYQLDQTEVQLIVMSREEQAAFQAQYPNNRFHSLQAQGIHRAARELDSPFIWLEVDAIPLKAGWAAALSAEYETCGKKFLISSDSHPPHDLVGGIGCYPQETDWLLPQHFPKSSWDMWLIEAVPHLVARTATIQHSYGWYNSRGFIDKIHEFPRDRAILRPGALLFHRDPTQSLII